MKQRTAGGRANQWRKKAEGMKKASVACENISYQSKVS